MILNVNLVRLEEGYKIHFRSTSGKFVSNLTKLASLVIRFLGKAKELTQLRGPYPNDMKS